ncbi:MAG: hypothetical protein WAO23_09220 [Dethiobacteria bacterium]
MKNIAGRNKGVQDFKEHLFFFHGGFLIRVLVVADLYGEGWLIVAHFQTIRYDHGKLQEDWPIIIFIHDAYK